MWLECRGWVGSSGQSSGKAQAETWEGHRCSGLPSMLPLQLSGFLAVLSAVAGSHPTPTPTWFYNEEGSGHCWIPVRSCRSQ